MIKLPENPCAICRKREVTQLCDFVTEYYWMSHRGNVTATCDLPMSEECSNFISGHDFCPEHKKMLPNLKLKDPVMRKRIHQHQVKMVIENDLW